MVCTEMDMYRTTDLALTLQNKPALKTDGKQLYCCIDPNRKINKQKNWQRKPTRGVWGWVEIHDFCR